MINIVYFPSYLFPIWRGKVVALENHPYTLIATLTSFEHVLDEFHSRTHD